MTTTSDQAESAVFSAKAALILIITFLVLLWAIIVFLIVQGYRDTETRSAEKAAAAAQAASINTQWIVEVAKQALRRMDSALGPEPQTNDPDAIASIRESLNTLPRSAKAYIVATNGETLYSTDPAVQPIDIRDRDYFSVPAKGQKFYTSSLLVSRLDDSQIFVFSRRLDRQGKFAGVAIISFDFALLADLWTSLDLEEGSTVSLIRDDGMLIARYPFADGPLDLSQHVLFTQFLRENEFGTYSSGASPLDGIARVVGYRKVGGTEIVALASVGTSEAFGRFWRGVSLFLGIVVPVVAALAAAAFWIIRLLHRDARRQAELGDALETNTMLFREIHHRVKNNLQSMHSLVRMQEMSPAAKADLHSRFVAMAAVHEHMYHHDAYAELDARSFIASIAEPVIEAYGSKVALRLDIDAIKINHDQATPLALLINEVMTNALKYAFAGNNDGTLAVALKWIADGRTMLSIADNGKGFDATNVQAGMGSRLIKGMVTQLNGTYSYGQDGGTIFHAELCLGGVKPL